MLPNDAAPTARDKAFNTIKKENALKEAQRNKTQQQADAALQADNRLLQAKVEKLENLLELRGASEDFLAHFKEEVETNEELKKENQQCQNRCKHLREQYAKLGKQYADGKTRERALKKELKNRAEAEKTNRDIERTSRDAEGKETNIEGKNTDTREKDIDNGEKNMGVGEKDSNTEEKNTDTAEKNTNIEERDTDDRTELGEIE